MKGVSTLTDGDIYWNPVFCDLWVVYGETFVKINEGCTIDVNDVAGFVSVGHVDLTRRFR